MGISFRLIILFIVLCLLAISGPALGQGAAETEEEPYQQIDLLIARGDYRQAWQQLGELPAAMENPDRKFWRMANVQCEMSRIAPPGENAVQYYQQAEKFARDAIASNPRCAQGYKWLAIALGARARASDTQTQIQLAAEIKENIEKSIALAPDDDISYLVLSRWHYRIATLNPVARSLAEFVYGEVPAASLVDAERLLFQAVALHDRIVHRYYLAKVYERMDRMADAAIHLQKALALPVTFPDEVEQQEKCRKMLEEWRQQQPAGR